MIGTAVLTLLAAGGGLYASRRTSRRIRVPLQSVRATLDRMTAGDVDERADTDGPVEVAQIATSVNLLADESARLRTVEEQELAVQQQLLDYQREVRESLDPRDVVRRATSELGSVLRADHVYVRLVEDGEILPAEEVWDAEGVPPLSDLARELTVGSTSGMQRLRDGRQSLAVSDTARHPFYDTEAGRRWLEATGRPSHADDDDHGRRLRHRRRHGHLAATAALDVA